MGSPRRAAPTQIAAPSSSPKSGRLHRAPIVISPGYLVHRPREERPRLPVPHLVALDGWVPCRRHGVKHQRTRETPICLPTNAQPILAPCDPHPKRGGRLAEQSDAFYHIVGRALSDPEFRNTLRSGAFRADEFEKMGITLTTEMGDQLDAAIKEVDALAEHFGAPQAAT